MDFVPGNDSSEWQVLGDEERYVLYQQVTVQEPMGWSGLSLDCYKAACGKYSGRFYFQERRYFSKDCVYVDCADSGKGLAVYTCFGDGLDLYREVIHCL